MSTPTASDVAIGIDIGGTGIKGAIVDLASGELLSERVKLSTPEGGKPKDIVGTVTKILEKLTDAPEDAPIGICFPAVVRNGRTMSAANVSKKWIGLEAEKLFEDALGRDIFFVNDADAAGYAEVRFGAARDRSGLVMMTTLGTGIGTAIIYNGVLVPNAELGHLQIDGGDYELKAAYSAKEREDLSWSKWTERLQKYYSELEKLLSPDLFIVGGGVSKNYQEFLPMLNLTTEIVPAVLRNNAGILGAAALAAQPRVVAGAEESPQEHPAAAL
ncbi:polyphosphate--glucose phosphotransferase [Agreia sp. VKM Ac-1783]|uniref:polyphosphate--glucose phosphotransferase n=1 Tax=Agreia sp. VKM Ac-1783 TaxID=1938889 RepID=UPI000A2AD67F|nr:ROK family protein [Agreia sp. VKM Ac-1783]SMQ67914.1 Polyphosphate glucokinase [Agreia sp. VKM Ac-1783]